MSAGPAAVNRQVRLAARPVGTPGAEVWRLVEEPPGEPDPGEVLVEVTHVSIDPAMRGWMDDRRSYIPPVDLDEVMRASCVGRVVASAAALPVDSWVTGLLGVQRYAVRPADALRRIDLDRAPPARWLGALGLTGLTAYFGTIDVGRAREGETVVVSGAAGAVGSIAAQIAKLRGCRTIGIAGGPQKCEWLREGLGLDAAIDYKRDSVGTDLRRLAPDGVDVYFDNVGGEILDLVLARLARGARVVICGGISRYNATEPWGPANYLSLLVNRASMTGLIVFDHEDRYPEATAALLDWIEAGKVEAREQVVRGSLEDFPAAFLSIFEGGNTGKLVLELT